MKNLKTIISFLFLAVLNLVSISCSRDSVNVVNELGGNKTEDVIEKGHDNWAKVEIIIREGHLHGVNFHGNPETNRPILPAVQKIIFEQTPSGIRRTIDKGNSLKKNEDVIEVLASPKVGWRYSMEIIYYNTSGQRINYQYLTPEQLPIHQHFFTINSYSNYKTKEIFSALTAEFFTHLHSYVYRDTMPEDKMIGRDGSELIKNNPVGLKGYFHFTPEAKYTRFNMVVKLSHFMSSKFNNGQVEPANNPSRRARLQSVTDFWQEIPFVVIGNTGLTDEEIEVYFQDVADYYGITKKEVEEYILKSDVNPESSTFWL